ncbi:MAG: MarR family transcriptional regulator, partial [Chloroflexi bacterium]|nr:MarR family transcriptional regulator [Chloroflexota bacterium]
MPSSNPEPSLIQSTLRLLEELVRSTRNPAPREWMECELTMPQLKILLFLHTDGPARVSDIAGSLGVTLPTATALIDRLVDRNLVVRSGVPEDRRVVLCGLTDSGRKLAHGLWQGGLDHTRAALEALSQD